MYMALSGCGSNTDYGYSYSGWRDARLSGSGLELADITL